MSSKSNRRPASARTAEHQAAVMQNRSRKTTVQHRLVDRTNRTRSARSRNARAEYGF